MTEEEVISLVKEAGGELVSFARSRLLNMWRLLDQDELVQRVEDLCEANGFEYRYDQATALFRIRLKDAPRVA